MDVNFLIENERLEWHKMHSLLSYGTIQNNSNPLAATLLKWNNENNQLQLILTHSSRRNVPSQVELLSVF